MKVKYFALAAVLALTLMGCSANRENNSADPVPPTNSVGTDNNGFASDGVGGDAQNSAGMIDNTPSAGASSGVGTGNDAAQGGGAGGTGGMDDSGVDQGRSRMGNAADDIGDAAGDLVRGAGNVVRDTGDAIGNAANDVGRAMH